MKLFCCLQNLEKDALFAEEKKLQNAKMVWNVSKITNKKKKYIYIPIVHVPGVVSVVPAVVPISVVVGDTQTVV
jgi:hypothetical protein